MPAFFSKLLALFQPKIAKNAVFALGCKISIAKLRLRFNVIRKIAELCCASTVSKNLLQKLRCALEIKKNSIAHLRFAVTG